MGQVVLSHETGRREAARGGPGFEAPVFALQPLSFSEFIFLAKASFSFVFFIHSLR